MVGLLAAVPECAVLAAVNHAEVVAARAVSYLVRWCSVVAVTTIEALIAVSWCPAGRCGDAARDTLAAVMITTNGIAGLSLLLGSLRYGVTLFNLTAAAPRWPRSPHWRR